MKDLTNIQFETDCLADFISFSIKARINNYQFDIDTAQDNQQLKKFKSEVYKKILTKLINEL